MCNQWLYNKLNTLYNHSSYRLDYLNHAINHSKILNFLKMWFILLHVKSFDSRIDLGMSFKSISALLVYIPLA